MTKGPIGEAVANVTANIITEAVENMKNKPQPINPAIASLDHMAAVAAIDIVKDTHEQMAQAKHTEQSALLNLVTTLVNEKGKPDNSQAKGFELAVETIREMSNMQIQMIKADRDLLAARLDRLERERLNDRGATAPPQDPQAQMIEWLDRQEAIMQRMGYTKRGGGSSAPAHVERDKSLIESLIEGLPVLIQTGFQMYSAHLQVEMRKAELAAMQAGIAVTSATAPNIPTVPPSTPPKPQPQQPQAPAPEPNNFRGEAPKSVINEAMRQEVGPDFDMFVSNFHAEIARMDKVINAKFIEGLQTILKEQTQDLEEQSDIMADHGALLADWYKQIPGNAHSILVSYKPILLSIHGFCEPERLDEDEDEQPNAATNIQ
jgi:hypothetical protein